MSVNYVSNANEASYFLNALAYVAQEGTETPGEISRMRTYYQEFYQKFGYEFIAKLRERIGMNQLSSGTMSKIEPWTSWYANQPGFLVGDLDSASEAGFLINAMAWVCEDSGFAQGEYDRMAEYFNEYYNKFGWSFVSDLQSRINAGKLSRDTMRTIAPQINWY